MTTSIAKIFEVINALQVNQYLSVSKVENKYKAYLVTIGKNNEVTTKNIEEI